MVETTSLCHLFFEFLPNCVKKFALNFFFQIDPCDSDYEDELEWKIIEDELKDLKAQEERFSY